MRISKVVQLTEAPPQVPATARMSPDRRRFAYWGRAKGVFVCVTNHEQTSKVATEGVLENLIAFSPDSKRLAVGASQRDEQFFYLDGVRLRSHQAIGNDSAVFSPDSKRFAYTAESKGSQKKLVVDGDDGPSFDGILGKPVFSANSREVAIAGRRGSKVFVDVNGTVRGPFDAIADGTPLFCEKSGSDIVVARTGQQWAILIDGVEKVAGDIVVPTFKAGRTAWVQRMGGRYHLFIDGEKGVGCDTPYKPIVFTDDGARVGFRYKNRNSWFVAINGHNYGSYSFETCYRLTLSERGDGWAMVVGKPNSLTLLVNGVISPRVETPDKDTLTFDLAGDNLYYAQKSRWGWRMVRSSSSGVKRGAVYKSVSRPVVSPNSQQVAYLGFGRPFPMHSKDLFVILGSETVCRLPKAGIVADLPPFGVFDADGSLVLAVVEPKGIVSLLTVRP